ncbi:colicin/pyocin immunity family protein [Yersinia pseudotuberculosis]|uniref:Colicin/pyocin immunity family protein n=2 Tax=Yersinia pseudotuberculosis complex TaxID=1649845 RepID=A0A380QG46_YERPU|nr:colicin/pyocin immunity family protein [Yersinia pseudotuberculosis]
MRNGNESSSSDSMTVSGSRPSGVHWGGGRGNNGGGDRHSSHKAVNKPKVDLLKTPEMQAYMAVGGMPAVITLIDNVWGITLTRHSVMSFLETNLSRVGAWAMRTSPIGVAVLGMMPSKIALDPPIGHYFTTPALPANRVTDTPKEALQVATDVVVNVRISDVTDAGVQHAVLHKTPVAIQRIPVVKAIATIRPNVFTAAVPGITPMHISVVDTIASENEAKLAAPTGKPTVTPIESTPVREFSLPVGRHTHDAIIVFPDSVDVEPIYLSVIRITSTHEIRQEAYNTYEIAKTEREVAERNRVQKKPFGSFIEEMTLQKTLMDSQVAETAAHIILLESKLTLLRQEEGQAWHQREHLIRIRGNKKFKYLHEVHGLRKLAQAKQGEIDVINQSIAKLKTEEMGLLMQQQRVNADLETAKITEPQRVENAHLTAEAAEKAARDRRISEEIAATEAKRQRMENERLAEQEWQRVEHGRLAAEKAARDRRISEEMAATEAKRQRMENERLAEQERQRVEGPKQQVSEASCAQQASAWQNRFTLPALQPSGSAQYSFAASGMSAVVLSLREAAELHNSFLAAQEQLSAIATTSASGSVAAMIALGIYQTKVGESSERPPGWNVNPKFVGSISLSAMGLPATESLASQGEMALPVRMRIIDAKDWIGCTEIYAVKTGVAGVLPKVKVGAAQYDESTGVYTFTTDSTPPRTLIFTPAQPPGAESRPILAPPGSTPATLQHTGEMIIKPVITPTILPLPQLYARDFHDYIIWFPADSGLEPVYVYLKSPRDEPGVVTGHGERITGIWLAGAGKDMGAPIPAQIADKLRGRRFSHFGRFRAAFWREVANDPELVGQFKPNNVSLMKKGLSPHPVLSEKVGGRDTFEIHHVNSIKSGGAVYDVDNLRVATPKRHIEIHSRRGGK